MTQTPYEQSAAIGPWDPRRYAREVGSEEIRWSRGFLRCRPERWFPGFAAHWLPLAHSMGLEMRIAEIRPALDVSAALTHGFRARVDGEPLVVAIDDESFRVLVPALCAAAHEQASQTVFEYMARRLLASLNLSWSGPASSTIEFEGPLSEADRQYAGAVKVAVQINTSACALWVLLSEQLVERFDGLWRRQVHSAARIPADDGSPLRIEVAQLGVPANEIGGYLRPGSDIDLQVLATDTVILKLGIRPWLPARLANVEGELALEMVPAPLPVHNVPDGSVRLSIEFGQMKLASTDIAEISQPGVIFRTAIPLSDRVQICANGEHVADGQLALYEGRLAVRVLSARQ